MSFPQLLDFGAAQKPLRASPEAGLPCPLPSSWSGPPSGPLGTALRVPRFCGECLQPCLQVPSPLCPLCRVPFDPKKVEKASSVEKQLAAYKAPCRGCSKKVKLQPGRGRLWVPVLLLGDGGGCGLVGGVPSPPQ